MKDVRCKKVGGYVSCMCVQKGEKRERERGKERVRGSVRYVCT